MPQLPAEPPPERPPPPEVAPPTEGLREPKVVAPAPLATTPLTAAPLASLPALAPPEQHREVASSGMAGHSVVTQVAAAQQALAEPPLLAVTPSLMGLGVPPEAWTAQSAHASWAVEAGGGWEAHAMLHHAAGPFGLHTDSQWAWSAQNAMQMPPTQPMPGVAGWDGRGMDMNTYL